MLDNTLFLSDYSVVLTCPVFRCPKNIDFTGFFMFSYGNALFAGFFIFRLSQLRRERRGNRGLMLLTELPRGDLVPLFKGADQMTAVRKAGLGCNIVQVIVGKKKQVFNLVQADKLDILLTALPVMLQKKFGKIGVAHVVFMCQCLDIDVFLGMAVEIDEDILHTLFLTLGNRFGIETDSLAVPDTQKPEKQCGKERIDIGIITVFLFKSLPLKGYKKSWRFSSERSSCVNKSEG